MPLTGVVTPFLSYGGSAMVANFAALGMLAAIRLRPPRRPRDLEPFRVPMRCLGARRSALRAVRADRGASRVQVVHADDYVVRPQLGVQADGGRRFEYNPRVLDIVRAAPARNDLRSARPAAGHRRRGRARRLAAARTSSWAFRWLERCPNPSERCYPLGGARVSPARRRATRANWTRVEHVVRRARRRGRAARLRRSRGGGPDARRERASRC